MSASRLLSENHRPWAHNIKETVTMPAGYTGYVNVFIIPTIMKAS